MTTGTWSEETRPSQRADAIPMPRSRPTQADLSAQIASSQAYAETNPRVDNRNFFEKFTDKIKLASLTPDDGLLSRAPDLAALGYDFTHGGLRHLGQGALPAERHRAGSAFGHGRADGRPRHVDQRMVGATPPATYDLKPRENCSTASARCADAHRGHQRARPRRLLAHVTCSGPWRPTVAFDQGL